MWPLSSRVTRFADARSVARSPLEGDARPKARVAGKGVKIFRSGNDSDSSPTYRDVGGGSPGPARRSLPGYSSGCPASAPRERRAAGGVQLARLVAGEAERRQEALLLAEQMRLDKGADADHLVSVVGVGDDVSVLAECVEYREAARGEGADPAGRLVPVKLSLAPQPLVAVSERRGPHPDEVPGHPVLRA